MVQRGVLCGGGTMVTDDMNILTPKPLPVRLGREGHVVRTRIVVTLEEDGKTWDTVTHEYECDCKNWTDYGNNHVDDAP